MGRDAFASARKAIKRRLMPSSEIFSLLNYRTHGAIKPISKAKARVAISIEMLNLCIESTSSGEHPRTIMYPKPTLAV